MDRNSILGIVLIFAILVVFSIVNQPSEEEIESTKRRRDSIAQVEAGKALQLEEARQQSALETQSETVLADSTVAEGKLKEKIDQLGVFGNAALG